MSVYFDRKNELKEKALKHTQKMEEQFENEIQKCVENTLVYGEEANPAPVALKRAEGIAAPKVYIDALDSVNSIFSHHAGKTAVLTQRVIRKIKDGCHVNRLLVLTFTNEAANEMKSRIRKSIIKENLIDELILLDSSYITTFDSYALSIVKKYHYVLNISNNINIVEATLISMEKNRIMDEVFEYFYNNEEPHFLELINDFCNDVHVALSSITCLDMLR